MSLLRIWKKFRLRFNLRQGLAMLFLYSDNSTPQPPRPNVGLFGPLRSSLPVSSTKMSSDRGGSPRMWLYAVVNGMSDLS